MFGDPSNFKKETLTFEVIEFKEAYHAILEPPCYVKFMAVPNYTYLKLKMPGPHGVITVGSTYQHVYMCEVESCKLASAVLAVKELALIRENIPAEAPYSNRKVGSFEPTESIKEISLDPLGSSEKKLRVSAMLTPK